MGFLFCHIHCYDSVKTAQQKQMFGKQIAIAEHQEATCHYCSFSKLADLSSKAMSLKEPKLRDNNNEIQQTHDRDGDGLRGDADRL